MISFNTEAAQELGPEVPSRETVVSLFTNPTVERNEALTAYELWLEQKQNEARESTDYHAYLKFNIEVAELLIDSQLKDEAALYIEDAWTIINNEGTQVHFDDGSDEYLSLVVRLEMLSSYL